MFRSFAAILLAALCLGGPAFARCEGALVLGGLHDAYRAMLVEEGVQRLRAARTVLVLLGSGDDDTLAPRIARAGIPVDRDRLKVAVEEARGLAFDVLAGLRPPPGVGAHSANVDWLGSSYEMTGCRNLLSAGSAAGRATEDGGSGGAPSPKSFRERFADEEPSGRTILLIAAAFAVVSFLAALGARQVMKSIAFRKRQVARQPRSPVDFALNVGLTGRTVEVRAQDISVGGMKLAWREAPEIGTEVSLDLPTGARAATVLWANAHYAGVLFAEYLSDGELKTLSALK